MTNYNKLNNEQKIVMAEFMKEHPQLAKNLLPNCVQGKATALRLWEDLTTKLNSVGPPTKDAKMWRKVFADQKYQAKKKLSFNKLSKRQTGGGQYEEKIITQVEEDIILASGLEVAVEGLSRVNTFGACKESPPKDFSGEDLDASSSDDEMYAPVPMKKTRANATDPKLLLLEKNLRVATEANAKIQNHLAKLVEIQQKILELKEKKYEYHIAIQEIDLQIKKKN